MDRPTWLTDSRMKFLIRMARDLNCSMSCAYFIGKRGGITVSLPGLIETQVCREDVQIACRSFGAYSVRDIGEFWTQVLALINTLAPEES